MVVVVLEVCVGLCVGVCVGVCGCVCVCVVWVCVCAVSSTLLRSDETVVEIVRRTLLENKKACDGRKSLSAGNNNNSVVVSYTSVDTTCSTHGS